MLQRERLATLTNVIGSFALVALALWLALHSFVALFGFAIRGEHVFIAAADGTQLLVQRTEGYDPEDVTITLYEQGPGLSWLALSPDLDVGRESWPCTLTTTDEVRVVTCGNSVQQFPK